MWVKRNCNNSIILETIPFQMASKNYLDGVVFPEIVSILRKSPQSLKAEPRKYTTFKQRRFNVDSDVESVDVVSTCAVL